jgi:hypothetical protein
VLLEGLDEHQGGVASLVDKFGSLSADLVSSVVDPGKVFLSNLDFVFNVFSVGGGVVTRGLVLVGNGQELGDLVAEILFHGSVNLISSSLGVKVGLFQVSEQLKSAVDGVGGLGLHVKQRGELVFKLRLISHNAEE